MTQAIKEKALRQKGLSNDYNKANFKANPQPYKALVLRFRTARRRYEI